MGSETAQPLLEEPMGAYGTEELEQKALRLSRIRDAWKSSSRPVSFSRRMIDLANSTQVQNVHPEQYLLFEMEQSAGITDHWLFKVWVDPTQIMAFLVNYDSAASGVVLPFQTSRASVCFVHHFRIRLKTCLLKIEFLS